MKPKRKSMGRKKILLFCILVLPVLIISGIVFCYWAMQTLPVAHAGLEKIELNMTMESVKNMGSLK